MSFGRRPRSRSAYIDSGGPPSWLIFLVAVALVFAVYYLWTGLRDFMATGGLGIAEATSQAQVVSTSTAERIQADMALITPLPTMTPLPECQDFQVISDVNANVRANPSTNSAILETFSPGEILCVIGRAENNDWYILDLNPLTRRIETAYISANIVRAVNPTPTPTVTFTPPPTITPEPTVPTDTPAPTNTPLPTNTPDPDSTSTPTHTPTPRPTSAYQSA